MHNCTKNKTETKYMVVMHKKLEKSIAGGKDFLQKNIGLSSTLMFIVQS